ncbi:hypothetical protein llap_12608 [Limosa lapponica baueri]|uniref:Cadherin domain-containing protein n=1 Tax=Limosa lapponica baueri TaxID=1758121 RepID=A0A2I0TTG6_LIMLA|nr:hypothetical protein llap_12608 [Limosa lapponica baueri]
MFVIISTKAFLICEYTSFADDDFILYELKNAFMGDHLVEFPSVLKQLLSEICGFKIHGQNVPFEAVVVDKSTGEGIIRSKEKLDCELQKDYTFTIQAYDCGKGPDGANAKKSHNMRLETCDEPITSIQATVELETNHIGKGCDRDTYSEKSIHRLCDMNRHHYTLYVHNCRLVFLFRQDPSEGKTYKPAEFHWKLNQVHMNPSQSTLTLEGDDIDRVDKAMQHISYLNSRQFPTPGIRRLKITSVVKCFNEEACVSIPSVEGYVMVLQPEEPKISLSGINHFARSASEFESSEGVSLFPELRIISTITREVEPEGDGDEDPTVQESLVSEEIMHNLDTCEVTVLGEELNQEQESLEIDMTRLQQKGIEMSSSNLGMIITGVDTMANYEEVLHLIRYRNWHTVSLFDRKFKLVCSELNGRYVSNEFKVEVNVIHTANPVEHANHIAAQPQFVHPVHHTFVDLSGHNLANPHPFSVVPSTATVVIVVCVSFLVFMIILGVFRIRAAHQRTMRDQDTGKENEMDWDDSALTITVNPMETYEDQHSSEEEEEEEEEESEDGEEDDITSAESESSEEEEGEQEEDQQNVNRQQQLEWDDSTLSY